MACNKAQASLQEACPAAYLTWYTVGVSQYLIEAASCDGMNSGSGLFRMD